MQTLPHTLLERLAAPELQTMRSLSQNQVLALTKDNCVVVLNEDAQEQSRLFCLDEMGLPYPSEFLQKIK